MHKDVGEEGRAGCNDGCSRPQAARHGPDETVSAEQREFGVAQRLDCGHGINLINNHYHREHGVQYTRVGNKNTVQPLDVAVTEVVQPILIYMV